MGMSMAQWIQNSRLVASCFVRQRLGEQGPALYIAQYDLHGLRLAFDAYLAKKLHAGQRRQVRLAGRGAL